MPSTQRTALKLSGGGKFKNGFMRSGLGLMQLFSTIYPRILISAAELIVLFSFNVKFRRQIASITLSHCGSI